MSEVDGSLDNGRNGRSHSVGRNYGSCYIIKEVYENGSACEYFESQLDFAIDSRVNTIIIEPTKLGRETASWISLGEWIKFASVTSGFCCLATGFVFPEKQIAYASFGLTSFVLGAVYTVSWQFDLCSRYKVELDQSKLQCLPVTNLGSSSPVVLVRKRGFPSFFYSVVSISCLSFTLWRLLK